MLFYASCGGAVLKQRVEKHNQILNTEFTGCHGANMPVVESLLRTAVVVERAKKKVHFLLQHVVKTMLGMLSNQNAVPCFNSFFEAPYTCEKFENSKR